MKLCAITTIGPSMAFFVVDVMREFVKRGDQVTLICSMDDSFIEKYSKEFNCINIPMKRGVSVSDALTVIPRLMRIFKKEKFDYIQYTTPNASLYASIAAKLTRQKIRVYCQWGLRYVGSTGVMRCFLKSIEKLTCQLSTHIRSASRKNLEFAINEGLFKAEKGAIIGDGGTIGVDLNEFNINQKQNWKKEILSRLPMIDGKFVFCFVGRIQKDKGVEELLEAFLMVHDKNPHTALFLLGWNDGKISHELLQRAQSCPDIYFIGFSNEVNLYLAASDALVHPSYREGFSMVIQQAMAMGLPVITTDIPGPSEVIEPEVSGLLVPSHTVIPFSEKMLWLSQHNDFAIEMGKKGYERVKNLFNRQRMIELSIKDRMSIIEGSFMN